MIHDALPVTGSDTSRPMLGAAQRVVESAVIALATSAGLYLVGSVYIDAYFARMSIDVSSLDLAPPFVALQSTHVLGSLLEIPTMLLVLYLIYRLLSSRVSRFRSWYDRSRQRLGRLFLLIVNVLTVFPLLLAALQAVVSAEVSQNRSLLGDISQVMGTFGVLLLIYLIWLSFGPRDIVLNQIRARKLIPIALIFALYLLSALTSTAQRAAIDAELLMMGESAASIGVVFTLSPGAPVTLPATELILVTTRNGNYYVVARQGSPPSARPVAYVIPSTSVAMAQMQRINAADVAFADLLDETAPSPVAP